MAPEFDCKIWQAGRATCAVGLAFKPVQIGQTAFHDDGAGTFNPAPEALDEAVVNEWPGREIGVFVSVGTGRRPKGSDANNNIWYEGFLGEFAEARRRLIAKIEGCEKIHEHMLKEVLLKRGVNVENYFRLNVEVGVGEFGMNEWHRLGEISTSTRRYMARDFEQRMILGISTRLAKILKVKNRWDRALRNIPELVKTTSSTDYANPTAIELPGDEPGPPPASPQYSRLSGISFDSGSDSLHYNNHDQPSPRNSHEQYDALAPPPLQRTYPPPPPPPPKSEHRPRPGSQPTSQPSTPVDRHDGPDRLLDHAPTPAQYHNASGADKIAIMSPDEHPRPPLSAAASMAPLNAPLPTRLEPPPLPPKTPLPERQSSRDKRRSAVLPPYPMDDETPPAVNMARKPDFGGRQGSFRTYQ